MTEIGIASWMDAVMGRANNPVAAREIVEMAENGQLIVVDANGGRHKPVKLDELRWQLVPETE